MNWKELKESIRDDLSTRGLSKPSIRINALSRIEAILEKNLPEYIQNPIENFGKIEKKDFKNKISKYKDNGKLNGAEDSVINEIYYRI